MNDKIMATGTSVEKALSILLVFTPDNTEKGTTEISLQLGLHKSTTSRLISILVAANFLQQNSQTRKYSLGRSAYRIGHSATRTTNTRLLSVAHPYLIELSQKTGESIALEIVSGFNVILAMHVEGPSHLRFNFQQGELVPINVAAGAKVILAYSDAALLESCLQQEFRKYNENTIVSKDEYRRLLAKIRDEGIAYDRGERYTDIHAMAVPVRNPEEQPIAAVIMAGPASRLTDSFLHSVIADLQETAENITRKLYF
jgi:DNA-binding IclR family transcriptional regulator